MSLSRSPQINEIALALSKFQGEVLNPTKGKKGYNYMYADLASVLEVTRPILAKNELSVIQMPCTNTETGQVEVETILTHSSGQFFINKLVIPIPAGQKTSMAQNIGSAISYARRYAYASMLGIAQDDNDAVTQISNKENITNIPSAEEVAKTIILINACETVDKLQEVVEPLSSQMRTKTQQATSAKYKLLIKDQEDVE
jgi:hypothetical protein